MRIINLLPPSEQKYLSQKSILGSLQNFVWISIFTYILVAVILVAGRVYLQQNLAGLDTQIADQQKIISSGDNIVLQKQLTSVNKVVADYNKLAASNPRWSKVLTEFAKLVPADIYLQGFSASADTGKIDINGIGGTRDSVLTLRSNIDASPLFRNIDLPLDNLEKATDTKFHYTFYLRDGVLSPDWNPATITNDANKN